MKLISATIEKFKSIENSGVVPIDPSVTVLVGQNESGKTAFLQALSKARSVDPTVKFDVVEDYPRRLLNDYEEVHKTNPAQVVTLKYLLEENDIERINEFVGFELVAELEFTLWVNYANRMTVGLFITEKPYVEHLVNGATLSTEIRTAALETVNVQALIDLLDESTLNADEQAFFEHVKSIFSGNRRWSNRLLAQHVYDQLVAPYILKFVYFDDYYLLPGKVNLNDLKIRLAGSTPNKPLRDEDRTAQSLLKLAGVSLESLGRGSGYESNRAKLEATGISIADKIFKFWKQNEDLEVEFDIRPDEADESPFEEGENLYLRIKNRRHRVSVPFSQRSKGFIWFFSFIAWFDGIRKDLEEDDSLILLLDEPGLSLHALAQRDFLNYIDHLSQHHQILYTTHSPFMVQSDRFHQARTVEDKKDLGTKISDNVSASDPATLFPLQAAVGYTIAQNLFIGKRNLLVEGISDLVYLQFFCGLLESLNREGLRKDIVIAPVGGLDKLATFIALIGANQLELVVLSDYLGHPDQRIDNLVQAKLIHRGKVLTYADFRDKPNSTLLATDVEDLITPATYLGLFNAAYKQQLNGHVLKASELPSNDRVVVRIAQHLDAKGITVRPSGGFNHHLPANYLAAHPLTAARVGEKPLKAFEDLFKRVNQLYT